MKLQFFFKILLATSVLGKNNTKSSSKLESNGLIYASYDTVPNTNTISVLRTSVCGNGRSPKQNYDERRVLDDKMTDPSRPGDAKSCKLLAARFPFKTVYNKCRNNQGECVEWADGRFHMLTGRNAVFKGDATDWAKLAISSGIWNVTTKPKPRSIMVLPGNTNTGELISGQAGHVAVVEGILKNGRICTSNWNAPHRMKLTIRAIKMHPSMLFLSLKKR